MPPDRPDPSSGSSPFAAPVLPKRFYEAAEAVPSAAGYALRLDGRRAMTPARHELVVPTRALADAIVAEWRSQGERIDPATMPATRLANTALDGVAGQMDSVRAAISAYAESDLLCYRAGHPDGLVSRQAACWDPVLLAIERRHGARFTLAEGVIHVGQPPGSLVAIARAVEAFDDPFRLTALHMLTTLTGSALIALAVAAGDLDPENAWTAAHVDEDWNVRQWGEDFEAKARRDRRHADFRVAVLALGLRS